jgi:polysaccharide export outer membrane protein
MKLKFVPLALFLYLLCACSAPKGITYFQDLDDPNKKPAALKYNQYVPKICTGDLLTITVSALDPAAVAPFNLPVVTFAKQTEQMFNGTKEIGSSQAMQTYTVDSDGSINFPVIGKVQLAEKTKREAVDLLQNKISELVKEPIVNIQIINYKVTVIGEVLKPGSYPVNSDRVTVLDAIGMANDLTIYGNRENVKVIRDNNGKQDVVTFDLTKSDFFSSPYFYLQQNDIVYVEPNDKRKKQSRYSQTDQVDLSVITAITSSISVIASVIVSIIAVNK